MSVILQVLTPEGEIVKGQRAPDLDPADLVELYRLMLFNRRVDERMTRLQRQGRIGFYVGSIGEEASIIASTFALEKTDWVVPCYREAGAAFVKGFSFYDFCCQLFGNIDDKVKGRQMPNHYCSPELRFTSISSPVGTQIPHATGLGLGARLSGSSDVVLVFFGDGATSTGDFHVACNFAGVMKTPTIFLCRNNQWAISVPVQQQTASETLAVKAAAYGFPGVRVDGNDVFAVYQVTQEAVARARGGDGPTLIEAITYRLGPHSTSDDPRAYRDESEVEEWTLKDPIRRFRTYLLAREYWSEKEDQLLEERIVDEIQSTLNKVEHLPPPPVESMFEDVFESQPWHLREQLETLKESKRAQPVEEKV